MGLLTGSKSIMDQCIEQCIQCLRACEECYDACLLEEDVRARINCIKVLNDCADICALSVKYMSRNSEFSKEICGLCALICEKCGQDCGMFEDKHCKECSAICLECATVCNEMMRK